MLIFKRVKDDKQRFYKPSQPSICLTMFLLTSLLTACGEQSGTPLKANTDISIQESAQPITTPPVQEPKLTIKLLIDNGATQLSTTEIIELIVDNSIVFEHLGTGDFFEAIYKKDGRRLLTNVDSGSLDDETLHDVYTIENNKLNTEFKGKAISSAIYKLDDRYLAAVDSDNGAVNYEIRDIVEAPITVAVLKSQNAKLLTNEEITQLFVGKALLIRDLFTGDEYTGSYSKNGIRTLNYINPSTTAEDSKDIKTSDPYRIQDNQIYSILDGNEIASTILLLDSHYYGALNVDDGAVHYEFIPQ